MKKIILLALVLALSSCAVLSKYSGIDDMKKTLDNVNNSIIVVNGKVLSGKMHIFYENNKLFSNKEVLFTAKYPFDLEKDVRKWVYDESKLVVFEGDVIYTVDKFSADSIKKNPSSYKSLDTVNQIKAANLLFAFQNHQVMSTSDYYSQFGKFDINGMHGFAKETQNTWTNGHTGLKVADSSFTLIHSIVREAASGMAVDLLEIKDSVSYKTSEDTFYPAYYNVERGLMIGFNVSPSEARPTDSLVAPKFPTKAGFVFLTPGAELSTATELDMQVKIINVQFFDKNSAKESTEKMKKVFDPFYDTYLSLEKTKLVK
jgi:hypothetical protein